MKLIYFLLFIGNYIIAQNVSNVVLQTNFDYQQINFNQHKFVFTTNFFEANPQNNNTQFEIIENVLKVKIFYNIVGAWEPNSFNQTIDNVYYNNEIPSNVDYIKMSTNVLTFEDNPPYNPITVEDVYFRIIDLNNLGTNFSSIENTTAFPNPTIDTVTITFGESQETYTITLQTILGQTVSKKTISGVSEVTYPMENEKGIYLLTIENGKGETSTQKIIKK